MNNRTKGISLAIITAEQYQADTESDSFRKRTWMIFYD